MSHVIVEMASVETPIQIPARLGFLLADVLNERLASAADRVDLFDLAQTTRDLRDLGEALSVAATPVEIPIVHQPRLSRAVRVWDGS